MRALSSRRSETSATIPLGREGAEGQVLLGPLPSRWACGYRPRRGAAMTSVEAACADGFVPATDGFVPASLSRSVALVGDPAGVGEIASVFESRGVPFRWPFVTPAEVLALPADEFSPTVIVWSK